MKRSFSFGVRRGTLVVAFGMSFIAANYGLVRLAYGLFLPDIQDDLGLRAGAAGYISSGSSLVYCLAAGVGFVLAQRRPRALVVAATITACAGVWGMSAAGGIVVFGAAAVLSSAGAGLASPAMVRIVARGVTPADVERSQTIVNAGTGPGLVGAGALAVLLLPDWRMAWVVIGAATATIAVGLLMADRSDAPDVGRTLTPSRSWLGRHIRPVTAALLLGAASSAVWTYGRSLFVATGHHSANGTVSAWIAIGVGASATVLTARASSRLAPGAAWVASASAMTGAVATLAVASGLTPVALGAFVVFGWGFTAATSALIAWTTRVDATDAASGTALLFVALVFGQAVGSTVLGVVSESAGLPVAFGVAALLGVVAVTAAVTRPTIRPDADRRRTVAPVA